MIDICPHFSGFIESSFSLQICNAIGKVDCRVGFDAAPIPPNLSLNILIDGKLTFYRADHSIFE